jgi:hypothetical protein
MNLYRYIGILVILTETISGIFVSYPNIKIRKNLEIMRTNSLYMSKNNNDLKNKSKIYKIQFNNDDIEEEEFNNKWNEIINRIAIYFCIYYIAIYIYFKL